MRLEFKIPMLPQSVNGLYKINFSHRTIYLSSEGRQFKLVTKQFMPPFTFKENSKFNLEMHFHGQWLYKNGKNKRADIQNLTKILIDAIFEKLGVDDSFLYSLMATKIQSDKTFTKVIINTIDEY